MPREMSKNVIVINTSPLIALIAGLDSLEVLNFIFDSVIVPFEVNEEINILNSSKFGAAIFNNAIFLDKKLEHQNISVYLKNSLDIGEASVIQCALDNNISTVCIDEVIGRRIARMNGLQLTGSLGIIVKAIKMGFDADFEKIVYNMKSKNIYISKRLIHKCMELLNDN